MKAHVQRTKLVEDYVTREQAVVMTHPFTYLASRHVPKDRLRQFFDEARVCVDAPWKAAELTVPKGVDVREAHKQAKQLFDELWAEHRPSVPDASDDTEEETEEVEV